MNPTNDQPTPTPFPVPAGQYPSPAHEAQHGQRHAAARVAAQRLIHAAHLMVLSRNYDHTNVDVAVAFCLDATTRAVEDTADCSCEQSLTNTALMLATELALRAAHLQHRTPTNHDPVDVAARAAAHHRHQSLHWGDEPASDAGQFVDALTNNHQFRAEIRAAVDALTAAGMLHAPTRGA